MNCKVEFENKLNENFGLTSEHIEAAKKEAQKQRVSLFESIINLGFASEMELLSFLSESSEMEFIDLNSKEISKEAVNLISAKMANHYHIIVVEHNKDRTLIAVCKPVENEFKNEIELMIEAEINPEFCFATYQAIEQMIRKYYGLGGATIEQLVNDKQEHIEQSKLKESEDKDVLKDASVLRLVDQIIDDAVKTNATDIHIEPYENDLRVRFRIDGILHDAGIPASAKHFGEGIVSRIKIMSGLDIAEKRLPQDGRCEVNVSNNVFDLRVSVLPTRFTQAVNIRILPRTSVICDFESLGMEDEIIKNIERLIAKPHGIILVTGPTGSGKTTTLYTCMSKLNDVKRKIITVEDPVEYDMHGLTQMQVNGDIGFTFSNALRSILRHDPDVILLGEIRDLETAETAIRTALTGHLVFSTLHTNSATAAITRLLDMGIEPYLAASSVEAILAQRLVRIVCPDCKEVCELESEMAVAMRSFVKNGEITESYIGQGCAKCRFTGYRGRTVITELLVVSDAIREMAIKRCHSGDIEKQAKAEGMRTLFKSGMDKAFAGITSLEEVLRATKGAAGCDE